MNLKPIIEFVSLLESKGLTDSITVVVNYILPEAKIYHISLYAAAQEISKLRVEPGNVADRLGKVLETLDVKELEAIDINSPL